MKEILIIAGLLVVMTMPAMADGVYVYPAKGQSSEQQQKDKGECVSWASEQTGFDPTAPIPDASPPPTQAPTSSAGRGLLRGALVGTAVGAIGGNAGKGAAIGAASGALVGGVHRRRQAEHAHAQQQEWAQQQADQYAQLQASFNRAYATCLQGRGYTTN